MSRSQRSLRQTYQLLGGLGILLLMGAALSGKTPSLQALHLTETAQANAVDSATQQAMVEAINDEYHARAYYQAVIDKFGDVRPFSNIVQAEERHVQLWEGLFAQYGLTVPEDTFAGNMTAPDTLLEACQAGVEAERADAEMYANFLDTIEDPTLQAVFTRLRRVSLENHLTAFERCVANNGQPCPSGQGRGQGRSNSHFGEKLFRS